MDVVKQSVYLQIVNDIKKKIALGLLKENDKLPSCREFALEKGINPNTVQRAYSALESEGFIFTVPKKGVYVSASQDNSAAEKVAAEKIAELKNAGFTRGVLLKLIDRVYGENYDKNSKT